MIFTNISELAEKKGLSHSEIERRAGLSKGTISKWKTSSPTVDSLTAVAKVLDVAVEVLIKGRR